MVPARRAMAAAVLFFHHLFPSQAEISAIVGLPDLLPPRPPSRPDVWQDKYIRCTHAKLGGRRDGGPTMTGSVGL